MFTCDGNQGIITTYNDSDCTGEEISANLGSLETYLCSIVYVEANVYESQDCSGTIQTTYEYPLISNVNCVQVLATTVQNSFYGKFIADKNEATEYLYQDSTCTTLSNTNILFEPKCENSTDIVLTESSKASIIQCNCNVIIVIIGSIISLIETKLI